MIVSHEHNFIYIHIPRTAGTSISKSLCKSMNIENWQSFIGEPKELVLNSSTSKINKESYRKNRHIRKYEEKKHVKARELRRELPNHVWNSYFKFSFVRNPWDRVLSKYLKLRKKQRRIFRFFWPKSPKLFELSLRVKYGILNARGTKQTDYIEDRNGNMLLDYVGKFERLEEDFRRVCEIIDLEAKLENNSDSTKRFSYTEFYSESAKCIVERAKAKDIEKFGYKF